MRASVRPTRNVRLCTAKKRLNLEAPIFAYVWTLTRYVRVPIFIRIVDVLDFHFQGQRFELSTLENSYVIISQMVSDRTHIAIANTYEGACSFLTGILTFDFGPF